VGRGVQTGWGANPSQIWGTGVSLWATGGVPARSRMSPGARGVGMSGAPGRGQIFPASKAAGKLKNWKSEKLTSRPVTRPTRISGFQNFRFSSAPRHPRNPADRAAHLSFTDWATGKRHIEYLNVDQNKRFASLC
jgi:hypothetical protein